MKLGSELETGTILESGKLILLILRKLKLKVIRN
jgi:hypothetical protein